MDDASASALIAKVYGALLVAEARHPNSAALAVLHGHLNKTMEAYIADHPAVVRPYDGEKPPG